MSSAGSQPSNNKNAGEPDPLDVLEQFASDLERAFSTYAVDNFNCERIRNEVLPNLDRLRISKLTKAQTDHILRIEGYCYGALIARDERLSEVSIHLRALMESLKNIKDIWVQ
ncbi:MAG: hypothetical protein HC866_09070 [Leptolyngbyaceae cyanobacterium RU_5_1]|nr:hypothetical protein [Leptolyngbyaceae cyanobacterium RU_5_1]